MEKADIIKNETKEGKKEQLEKDLILAEKEYDQLFESINKRRELMINNNEKNNKDINKSVHLMN